jgi:hypothetical protein
VKTRVEAIGRHAGVSTWNRIEIGDQLFYVRVLHIARMQKMDTAREPVTERVITLMTPTEKSSLEKKARDTGISVGEFVRRSVDAYDPEEAREIEKLVALAAEVKQTTERASAALDKALASAALTFEQLEKRRA